MSGSQESTNPTMDMLVTPRRFTRQEWCTLIEHRLDRIRPCLSHLTLETLGQFLIVPFGMGIALSQLRDQGVRFSTIPWRNVRSLLNYQGLFFSSNAERWDHELRQITLPLWGLLRKGPLVMMTLHFAMNNLSSDEKPAWSAGEVTSVVIEDTDMSTILNQYPDSHYCTENNGPSYLYWQIGQAIEGFASRRYHLYLDAQRLEEQFKLEDTLLERTGAQKREPAKQ